MTTPPKDTNNLPTIGQGQDTDLVLLPAIHSYFTNGIPISELHISAPQKKQLNAVINAWNFYQQNPWCTEGQIRHYLKCVGRSPMQIGHGGDLAYFNYIKQNFSLTSRVDARNMVDYLARSAAKSASMAGDRQDQLKAAALLIKAHQLDKPAPVEAAAANTATLPMFLTTKPTDVSENAEEYTDEELEKEMKRFGAAVNPYQEKINKKKRALSRDGEVIVEDETEDNNE